MKVFCRFHVAFLSLCRSLYDRCYSVSRVFYGQWRKNGGAVNIYLSLTHARRTHTHVHAHAHTHAHPHTLSLIQSQALPVTFISVITMAGRLNGEIHTTMDTHHIDIWITHVWINHTTLMWLVDEALKQLTDRGHLRWNLCNGRVVIVSSELISLTMTQTLHWDLLTFKHIL